jgi:hypothetical protein
MASQAPLASYAAKPASATQLRFTNWLVSQVGLNLDAMTPAQAFENGVALATVLRPDFQASPENQDVLERRRQEKQQAAARREARRAADAELERTDPVRAAELGSREPKTTTEPVQSSAPAPRRRGKSKTAKAAEKTAAEQAAREEEETEDESAVALAAPGEVDDPFADDPGDDDFEGAPPPGSLWLGGPSAAAKGAPADGAQRSAPAPW